MADVQPLQLPVASTLNANDAVIIQSNLTGEVDQIPASNFPVQGTPITRFTNPYKFAANNSGGQTIPNNGFTKVTFSVEEFDTGSNFDSVTNHRFTAAATGFYQFSAEVNMFLLANTHIVVGLYKNGVELRRFYEGMSQNATANNGGGGSSLVQLVANDFVEIYTYQAQGSSGSTTPVTWFTGFLVSTT